MHAHDERHRLGLRALAARRDEIQTLEGRLAQARRQHIELQASLHRFLERYHRRVGSLAREWQALEQQLDPAHTPLPDTVCSTVPDRDDVEIPDADADVDTAAPAISEPPAELKVLYRRLARRIHPDRARDEVERLERNALMVRANAAFAAGDRDALDALLAEVTAMDSAAQSTADLSAQLVQCMRTLARLRRALREVEATIGVLRTSADWQFMEQTLCEEARGHDPLGRLACRLEARIREAHDRLDAQARRASAQRPFPTRAGDWVSSAAEAALADRLHGLGLCYRYRPTLAIAGGAPLRPLFAIERAQAPVLWEHVSRHENPAALAARLSRYLAAGYRIGEDLLLSHEHADGSLDLERIERQLRWLAAGTSNAA